MNLVVAAHPDDEIIGLGAHIPQLQNTLFVHATDGAPHDMSDAVRHGFQTRHEYAAARRQELLDALSLCGIPEERCIALNFVDQEATANLCALTLAVYEMIRGCLL